MDKMKKAYHVAFQVLLAAHTALGATYNDTTCISSTAAGQLFYKQGLMEGRLSALKEAWERAKYIQGG